jgi:sulfate/thiosulfate transport system permease protein
MTGRLALRSAVLLYLAALLILPLALIFWRTFEHGIGPAIDAVLEPETLHALWLTVLITVIAVPLNAVFGVAAALVLVRQRFRGQGVINSLIDLPFAMSPVVIGLALLLLFGLDGWFGSWFQARDIQVVYALPSMVCATVIVSLPFVVREVAPVLREMGDEQEQAARTLGATSWQTFRRITLPGLRPGLAFGVVLATARALGEFGAVSVVSGHLVGKTETLPLRVEERFQSFDLTGAYASAVVLALLAVGTLVATRLVHHQKDVR